MSARKPISKRLRFAIFARDGFTCRYCGRQSDEVTLHIDHITPVVSGGTNDEANLLTSCADCNLGKGARAPNFSQPTERDRLRAAQELSEQKAASARAQAIIEEMRAFEQDLVDLWCGVFDVEQVSAHILPNLVALAREHGVDRLAAWCAICAAGLRSYPSDHKRIKYIYGIRRNALARTDGPHVA